MLAAMKQVLAVVVIGMLGCGGSSKPPAAAPPVANKPADPPPAAPAPPPAAAPLPTPSQSEFDAMMLQAVAMFEAMGQAADAAGGDCGKLADGIDRVFDAHRDFITTAQRYKDNPEMDRMGEAWMKDHGDQVMPAMVKLGNASGPCMSDPRFVEVMKRMEAI